MQELNLPTFKYKVKKQQGKPFIWDEIRKKYIQITPEEWVRQHFIHYLISEGYSKPLISVEAGLKYNQRQKRSDILVFDLAGQPFLLVECKAPQIALTQAVLEQAIFYNQVIKAPYIALSNGLQHLYCHLNPATQQIAWLEKLPPFSTE